MLPTTMYLDSTLNKWRPKLIQRWGGKWVLRVKLEAETFLEFRIEGSTFKITVTTGSQIHTIGPSQFKWFGDKYHLPIEEVVTVLIERWRFLNLIAEF